MKEHETTGQSSPAAPMTNRVDVTIWLDKDVVDAIKASGPDWEDRVNDVLRADIEAGRLKKLA